MKNLLVVAAVLSLCSVAFVAHAQTVTDQYKTVRQPQDFKADVVMEQRLYVDKSLNVDGGLSFAGNTFAVSYKGSHTSDLAWLDGGSCNTFTVSGISGPLVGDTCNVAAELPMPFGLQFSCQFQATDGGLGAASKVVETRCCNDTGAGNGCDPVSTTYHLTGFAQ